MAFADNSITTSKYTWLTAIPLSLFGQFRRVANVYFLIISLLMCIGTYFPNLFTSPLTPWSTLLTLCFVLGVTMVIDISDDVKRHHSDAVINSRPSLVLGPADFLDVNDLEKEWRELRVGDIVRVDGKRAVPADLILLSTSEENDVCYVETSNIDGETNLKIKQAVSPELARQSKLAGM